MSVVSTSIKMEKSKKQLLEQMAVANCRSLSQEINFALNMYINYMKSGQMAQVMPIDFSVFNIEPAKEEMQKEEVSKETLTLESFGDEEVEEF